MNFLLPIILLAQINTAPLLASTPVVDPTIAKLKAQYLMFKAQQDSVDSQIRSLLMMNSSISAQANEKLEELKKAGAAYCKNLSFNPEEQKATSEAGSCQVPVSPSEGKPSAVEPPKPVQPSEKK